MFVMFIAKYDSDKELDLAQIFDPTKSSPDTLIGAFNNPIYKKALALWLPFLDKRGYLDAFLPQTPISPFLEEILSKIPKPEAPVPENAEEWYLKLDNHSITSNFMAII